MESKPDNTQGERNEYFHMKVRAVVYVRIPE